MQIKSQPTGEREMRLSVSFDRADLRLEYSLIGVVVHLTGCPTVGEPGSPALPQCGVRVALPPQTRLNDVQAETRETVPIGNEVLPIAPLQSLRPGINLQEGEGAPAYRRPDEEQRDYKLTPRDQRHEEKPFVEPLPVPSFVSPDPDRYAEATRRPTAQLLATSDEGLTPVASINLNPVHLTADGLLEFRSQIDLTLRFEPVVDGSHQHRTPANVVSRAQAMRQVALTRLTVVNPVQVLDHSDLYPIFNPNVDYLIITDNQTWNGQTMTPTGAAGGDMVASFERLAAWKRQRGLKAWVITISDIVADSYGNFRTGSRDLQEVIRKFLQMAQANWGVAWVLLGGDTEIVPIRRAATDVLGGVIRQANNPPPENTSFWTGSHLRIHATNLGVWWGAATTNLLVRPDNGLLIPYDQNGTSNSTTRGWYFTTNDSYTTRTAMPTNFVRVNGPANEVNADLQFLYEWNTIPTDFYYSSLVGPQYNQPGKHDWDLTDNGVYGQHAGSNLDGINFTPTVSLGRASVRTARQANAFVNKVIAYEKYERPDGTRLDSNWTKRVVLVSENWGGRLWIGSTANNPPDDNSYHHPAGASHSLIKLKDTPNWNWSLLTYISEGDVRLLPYRTDAATVGRGWYFAGSSTNLSPNTVLIPLSGGGFMNLPFPSQWIAVYGTAEELMPTGYIFNSTQLDGSLADQEELRQQLRSEMAGFYALERLYEDIEDMTAGQIAAGPVELITSDRLRDALNAGPHIVSLSGHGTSYGCCKLGHDVADSLTNGYHTFIAYADSCLTNQLDADAVSEHLIANPNGGAVAYLGNTRFSWIGVGDDYQRRFFNEWATLGGDAHLGLLNDTRASLYGSNDWWSRWAMLALNLTGDPEMPVWWREPLKFRIPEVYLFDKLKLILDPPVPPDPLFEQPYSKNWGLTYVHLRQGEREQLVLADPNNRVELPLADFQPGAATLTVTRPGHQPIVQRVKLGKSQEGRSGSHRLLVAILLLLGGLALGRAVLRRLLNN
jgi:Peptidase family C25